MKTALMIVIGLLAGSLVVATATRSRSEKHSFDAAAYYKASCVEWHGWEAEKFNPELPEWEIIDVILNGEKMEAARHGPLLLTKESTRSRRKH